MAVAAAGAEHELPGYRRTHSCCNRQQRLAGVEGSGAATHQVQCMGRTCRGEQRSITSQFVLAC